MVGAEAERLYRETIAQAGAVPYVYDYAQNRYTYVAAGIEGLTGIPAGEFLAPAPDERDVRERFNALIQETVVFSRGPRPATLPPGGQRDECDGSSDLLRWHADQRILTPQGETRWLSDSAVEIAGTDGRWLVGMLQDVTDRKRTEDEARRLAGEQAALHRVATLVAQGAEPQVLFEAVCSETGQLLGAARTELANASETLASWRGANSPDESTTVPVVVDGNAWGTLTAGWSRENPPRHASELSGFAELVAMAISNGAARGELLASRARILAAADAARSRIERDLHDGTQQQLLALDLELQLLQASLSDAPEPAREHLERIREFLGAVTQDVQEISRGIHPATLTQRGLGPALRSLCRRSMVPAELTADVPERLPDPIETAAYYVVSEALTNTAKHASASHATITATVIDSTLHLTIADDGTGGARTDTGSGLAGLIDRVETLGGAFQLSSPPGHGTRITAEFPTR